MLKPKLTIKQFEKLTKSQQRVAIAQDAQMQLMIGSYKADQGIWVHGGGVDGVDIIISTEPGKNMRSLFLNAKTPCDVCGLGGLFLSLVRTANKIKTTSNTETFGIHSGEIIDNLKNYFSKEQLSMIEISFELGDGVYLWALSNVGDYPLSFDLKDKSITSIRSNLSPDLSQDTIDKRDKALKFGLQSYTEPTWRMFRILQNIIVNRGTFKP
jgi:hypothetical protein